jgi:hypothetical protein
MDIDDWGYDYSSPFVKCPKCKYISNDQKHVLAKLDNPCPECQKPGYRYIFPNLSAHDFLSTISYFHQKLNERIAYTGAQLQDKIKKFTGTDMGQNELLQFSGELKKYFDDNYEKDPNGAYSEILRRIQERLKTTPENELYFTLMTFDETFEEDKVIIILTSTLLENLYDELLYEISQMKNIQPEDARNILEFIQGREKRNKYFRKLVGIGISDLIAKSELKDYYDNWSSLVALRNSLVHGKIPRITRKDSDNALNLSQNACSMFAYLQNQCRDILTKADVTIIPKMAKVDKNNR